LTFDGLKYDCHGEGEFILVQSRTTRREIQARYQHVSSNKAASIATGFVVQDEGDTPRVQVSIPFLNSTVGEVMNDRCKLELFVDGLKRNFEDGSGQEDKVNIIKKDNDVWIKYLESEMTVKIRYFQCHVSICVHLPDTDPTIGLLGTATGTISDDWTKPDGSVLDVPEFLARRMQKPAYDFCTENFCIQNKADSLFAYSEAEHGLDFQYYEKCDLPYGSTLDQVIFQAPKDIVDMCSGDLQCILDVNATGRASAQEFRESLHEYSQQCNAPGGECDESSCCEGECVDFGGFAGKLCSGNNTVGQLAIAMLHF